jgi:hypothetical protein
MDVGSAGDMFTGFQEQILERLTSDYGMESEEAKRIVTRAWEEGYNKEEGSVTNIADLIYGRYVVFGPPKALLCFMPDPLDNTWEPS